MEAVQFYLGVLPGADVLADQIQLGHGDVKGVGSGILDLDIVFHDAVKIQLVDPGEDADAVGHMDDVVPFRQIGERFYFLPFPLPGLGGGGDHGFSCGSQGEADGRVFKSGGKRPRHDQHFPILQCFQILDAGGGKPHPGQVVCKGGSGFRRSRQHDAAVPLFQ